MLLQQCDIKLCIYFALSIWSRLDIIDYMEIESCENLSFGICKLCKGRPDCVHKWASAWDFQQCGMCDQQRLRSACAYVQSDQSLCSLLEYSISVKLLTEHLLEVLSLKGGSSESTLVKMPHCWKSHVTAQMWVVTQYSHMQCCRFYYYHCIL